MDKYNTIAFLHYNRLISIFLVCIYLALVFSDQASINEAWQMWVMAWHNDRIWEGRDSNPYSLYYKATAVTNRLPYLVLNMLWISVIRWSLLGFLIENYNYRINADWQSHLRSHFQDLNAEVRAWVFPCKTSLSVKWSRLYYSEFKNYNLYQCFPAIIIAFSAINLALFV